MLESLLSWVQRGADRYNWYYAIQTQAAWSWNAQVVMVASSMLNVLRGNGPVVRSVYSTFAPGKELISVGFGRARYGKYVKASGPRGSFRNQ